MRCGQPRQPAGRVRRSGHPFACPARSRVSDGELRRRQPPASCGGHRVLLRASFRQPRFRPPPHGSRAARQSCLGWAAPCPRGACGNPKCRFVAFQAKLPLELDGRYAGGLTGNQIGGPEPCAQRYVAAFHDRPGRQSHLAAAFTAGQNSWPRCNAERFSGFLTMGTGEAVAPAGSFQIGSTRPVIGKKPLKLRKRLRKWQVVAVEDVHGTLSVSYTIYPWWVCASNG